MMIPWVVFLRAVASGDAAAARAACDDFLESMESDAQHGWAATHAAAIARYTMDHLHRALDDDGCGYGAALQEVDAKNLDDEQRVTTKMFVTIEHMAPELVTESEDGTEKRVENVAAAAALALRRLDDPEDYAR